MERLEFNVARCNRYGERLAIIMFDLDHFKSVNDTHGHLAGDEVLRTVAAKIQQSLRDSDLAGRYGGEEIIVILSNQALDGAIIAAERIRSDIEKLSFTIKDLRVTISGGIGILSGQSTEELIDLADKNLYRAKISGRNCIVT
jgi:diguanylate cyclase (GGDEF)-like protein